MTPRAESILLLLRGNAPDSLQAIRAYRQAAPWVQEGAEWSRRIEFDGEALDEGFAVPAGDEDGLLVLVTGNNDEGWTFDTDPLEMVFASAAETRIAADIHHTAQRWTLR